MSTLLKWIADNRDWLFSGIGLALVTALIRFITTKKRKIDTSPSGCIYLTLIPGGDSSPCIGRKRELRKMKHLIRKHTKLNITGVVGIGKTSFCTSLVNAVSHQFSQVGWIPYQSNLYSSVASVLPTVNKEQISTNGIEETIKQILISLDSEALLFIDGVNDTIKDSELDVLLSCRCTVIINSILPDIDGFYNYELKPLGMRDAITLFYIKAPYWKNQISTVKAIVNRHSYGIPLLIIALSNVARDYYRINLDNFLSLLDSHGLLELSWAEISSSGNSRTRKKVKEILYIAYRISELGKAETDLLKKITVLNTGYYLHDFLLKLCSGNPAIIVSLLNKRWIIYLNKENCYYVSLINLQVLDIVLEPNIDVYLQLYKQLKFKESVGSIGRYENYAVYSELLAVNSIKQRFNESIEFNTFLNTYIDYLAEGPDFVLALKWNSVISPNTLYFQFAKAFSFGRIYMGVDNGRAELYGIEAIRLAQQMNKPLLINSAKGQLMLLYAYKLKNFEKAQEIISDIKSIDYIGDYICCLAAQTFIALCQREYGKIEDLIDENQQYFSLFEKKEPKYTSWLFDDFSDYYSKIGKIDQEHYYREKSVQLLAIYYGYGENLISRINRSVLKAHGMVTLVNDHNQYGFLCAVPKLPKEGIKSNWEQNINTLDVDSLFYYAIQEKLSNNQEKAADLLWLSIKRGNLNAYCELGVMYALGDYDELNLKIAYDLWTIGSLLGNAFCKCNLAIMYKCGLHLEKDTDRALSLLKSATNSGCYKANRHIGDILYESGQVEAAKESYMCASEYGCEHSSCAIARIYQYNYDDIQNALIFYELAQEQGYPELDSTIEELKTTLFL